MLNTNYCCFANCSLFIFSTILLNNSLLSFPKNEHSTGNLLITKYPVSNSSKKTHQSFMLITMRKQFFFRIQNESHVKLFCWIFTSLLLNYFLCTFVVVAVAVTVVRCWRSFFLFSTVVIIITVYNSFLCFVCMRFSF